MPRHQKIRLDGSMETDVVAACMAGWITLDYLDDNVLVITLDAQRTSCAAYRRLRYHVSWAYDIKLIQIVTRGITKVYATNSRARAITKLRKLLGMEHVLWP